MILTNIISDFLMWGGGHVHQVAEGACGGGISASRCGFDDRRMVGLPRDVRRCDHRSWLVLARQSTNDFLVLLMNS
jgi:hypothetical protein